MESVPALSLAELAIIFGHFLVLSLLSIGGAITMAPDMHRYVVTENHWITDAQFTASIALAQASPGPNVLFVAVIGWNVAGPIGMLATLVGILLPSTALALTATRWRHTRGETIAVRAFASGMAPLTVGLLVATGWLLAAPTSTGVVGIGLVIATVVVMAMTRLSPMWAIAIGAAVGATGWV